MRSKLERKNTRELVFVHDHKFRRIDDEIYSNGGLSDDALIRYTDVFGSIKVIARIIDEEKTGDRYSEITNPNVEIFNATSMSRVIFKSKIKNAGYVIARMPSFYGLKAIKIAKKNNVPYLIEMVGCPWDALWNHSIRGKIIAPYMTIRTRNEISNAHYVSYVTNEFLQTRYPTNGKTVSCSNVALVKFDKEVLEKRVIKIKNNTENKKKILGTTAAVDVRYKGQQYVIEVLKKLKEEGYENYEYQLVGGGDHTFLKEQAVKYGVEDQVKFLGSLPHKKVFEWLDDIDIYIQPSRQEGLPRALIEAMSRALPAIGARTAGIPELLDSDFIFSNTRKNIDEIYDILIKYDAKTMCDQAKTNYHESMKYDKNIIEKRREIFLKDFKNNAV